MPSVTRLLSSPSRWLALAALAVACLNTGCQSARPAFLFQPTPQPATAAVAVAPVVAADVTPASETAVAPPVATKRLLPMARGNWHRTGVAPAPRRMAASVAAPRQTAQPAPVHRRALLARPQASAEAGLGTTVLGVLGLVVLPIALLGLALSGGGLVWAIVAGAAAVAVLVAYLDPDKR